MIGKKTEVFPRGKIEFMEEGGARESGGEKKRGKGEGIQFV